MSPHFLGVVFLLVAGVHVHVVLSQTTVTCVGVTGVCPENSVCVPSLSTFCICTASYVTSDDALGCNFDCGPLDAPTNGQINAPDGFIEDSVVTYSCIAGFSLTGNEQRTCDAGIRAWTGTDPTCDEIDECASTPCTNGVCTNQVNGFVCSCNPGDEGTTCNENIDECASDPCQNGGTCGDAVNGYTCSCVPGYTGAHCEQDIDECASNPCSEGACLNNINTWSCVCNNGYRGITCGTDIQECASDPCINGGSCFEPFIGSFYCSCPGGYTSTNCEQETDECSSDPCQNGATCNDLINQYTCDCVPGYMGVNCQTDTDECANNPCQNGATCMDQVNRYVCTCAPGYESTNCNINIDECASDPCQNGATCTDDMTSFICTCPLGYPSTHCEEVADPTLVMNCPIRFCCKKERRFSISLEEFQIVPGAEQGTPCDRYIGYDNEEFVRTDSFRRKVEEKTQTISISQKEAELEVVTDTLIEENGNVDAALLHLVDWVRSESKALPLVDNLIRRGANISTSDTYSYTPLRYAIGNSFIGVAAKLLEQYDKLDPKDMKEDRALSFAIFEGLDDTSALIISHMPKSHVKELFSREHHQYVFPSFTYLLEKSNMKKTTLSVLDCMIESDDSGDNIRFYYHILESDQHRRPPDDPTFIGQDTSPLHIIARQGNKSIVNHPVVKRLIRQKWKTFAKRRFQRRLDYFTEALNYADFSSAILILCVIPLRYTENNAQWHVFAFGYLFWIIRIFEYALVFRQTGAYVQALFQILSHDFIPFGAVFIVILLAFSGSFFLALRGDSKLDTHKETSTFWGILFVGVRTLTEAQPVVEYTGEDGYGTVSVIFMMCFLFTCYVILLNILIALLTTTYQKVHEDAHRWREVNVASTVVTMELNALIFGQDFRQKYYKAYEDFYDTENKLQKWNLPSIDGIHKYIKDIGNTLDEQKKNTSKVQENVLSKIQDIEGGQARQEKALREIQARLDRLIQLHPLDSHHNKAEPSTSVKRDINNDDQYDISETDEPETIQKAVSDTERDSDTAARIATANVGEITVHVTDPHDDGASDKLDENGTDL